MILNEFQVCFSHSHDMNVTENRILRTRKGPQPIVIRANWNSTGLQFASCMCYAELRPKSPRNLPMKFLGRRGEKCNPVPDQSPTIGAGDRLPGLHRRA